MAQIVGFDCQERLFGLSGRLIDRLTEIHNRRFTTYPCNGYNKIRKILSHKVGNVVTMVVGVFRSTEINF